MSEGAGNPTRRATVKWLLIGVLIGIVAMGSFVMWDAYRRSQLLATMDFRTHGPVVPDNVLDTVRNAELQSYHDMGFFRQRAEDAQDAIALMAPRLAFAWNFSLGPYRIKASTVDETLDFALQRGYLTLDSERSSKYNEVIPFFVMQPSLNDWEASVLLEYLKQRHPELRKMTWEQIAADPTAIAKLYSGYMGAGGDWRGWESSLEPGAVAKQRLGYDRATGTYTRVEPTTPAIP